LIILSDNSIFQRKVTGLFLSFSTVKLFLGKRIEQTIALIRWKHLGFQNSSL
jgi:hypothetical protein